MKYFIQYQQYVPTEDDAANKEWFFATDNRGVAIMLDDMDHAKVQEKIVQKKEALYDGLLTTRIIEADKIYETD